MATAVAPLPRRIGQSKTDRLVSLHGDRFKKEPPSQRPPIPDDEDINRPPDDSSEDEFNSSEIEFEDEPAAKRRKRRGSDDSMTMGSKSGLLSAETSSTRGTLFTAPSNIQSTVWTSSQKQSQEEDDDEEPFSLSQRSQSRKSKNTYKRNVHVEGAKPKEKKRMLKTSPIKASRDERGFKKRDMADLEAKCTSMFKIPPKIDFASPREQRASERSTRHSDAIAEDEQSVGFKTRDITSSGNNFPLKLQKERPTFRKRIVSEITSPQKLSRAFKAPHQPLALKDTDEIGIGDMEGLLQKVKTKSLLPFKVPPSSTTESSLLSTSNEAGSSSSLSSPPPESPGSSQPEVHDLTASKAQDDEPTLALCPVCKATVDRAFLEEYNDGNPLRARQQTQFCKAHKVRLAEQEWREKGYPTIDWGFFDKRLEKFHSFVESILSGKRASYYRNAFEDRISKGQMKSLKAILLDSASTEGVIPAQGYYGSRGARAMYVLQSTLQSMLLLNRNTNGL